MMANCVNLALMNLRLGPSEGASGLARHRSQEGEGKGTGCPSGGVASLEIVLKDVISVQGFIVLCPAMPEGFFSDEVGAAFDRGVRGTLLTTEMDGRVDQQRRMVDIMEEVGLAHEFHIP